MIKKINNAIESILYFGVLNAIKLKLNKTESLSIKQVKFPISLRPKTTDKVIFKQIFVKKQYDVSCIKDPAFIIDGGANIGLASIYFANKFPSARIIAIEPDEENFRMLKKNVSYYKNINAIQAGIWNKNIPMTATDKHSRGEWGVIVEEDKNEEENKQSSLKSVTISDIVNEYKVEKIDLLKLDIETSEKEVFSDNFADWLTKTKVIAIELHDNYLPGCSKTFFSAIDKTFNNYSFSQKGEITIIINNDMANI